MSLRFCFDQIQPMQRMIDRFKQNDEIYQKMAALTKEKMDMADSSMQEQLK